MARIQTTAYDASTFTERPVQVDDIVYNLTPRGQYKHTMHRVRRVADDGVAVTCCTIWLRHGAVLSSTNDAAVWCEYGCKPFVQEAN